MNFQYSIWISLFLLIVGCRPKSAQQRLAGFINDPKRRITQSVTAGGIKVISKLIPDNLKQVFQNNQEGGYLYFDVKIESGDNVKHSKEKILYLDFDIQNDFTLLNNSNVITPSICQRIENGITGNYQYIVAFELPDKVENNDSFILRYSDKVFGAGEVAFTYNKKDILKIPGI